MEYELTEERVEEDGKVLRFYQDTDCPSPRDYDQLGIFVDWHRRDRIGDREVEENERNALLRGGWKLLTRYLRRYEGATVVLPVSMYEHSGRTIWVDRMPLAIPGEHIGWDTGVVGFIYDSAKTREATGAPLESIADQLKAEIEEYDKWMTGDCWGYVIEDEKGEHLDSCWGFVGFAFCKEEAMSVFKDIEVPHPWIEAGLQEVQ